jgi:hypothetical protein
MARTSQANFDAKLRQLQKRAQGLLTNLRGQIRAAEIELARLRKEESRISGLTGRSRSGAPAAARRRTGKGGRIDWSKVLQQMPKQFKAANVRAVRGLKDKGAFEIFAGITRWMEVGAVKRRARGTYERVRA